MPTVKKDDMRVRYNGIDTPAMRLVGCLDDAAKDATERPALAVSRMEVVLCSGEGHPDEMMIVFTDYFGLKHFMAMNKAAAEGFSRIASETAASMGGPKHEPETRNG